MRTGGAQRKVLKMKEIKLFRYESSVATSPLTSKAASGILMVFYFHQFHSQKCVFRAYGSFWMLLGSSGMPRGCFMGPQGCSVGPSKNRCFYKVLELWGAIRAKRDLPGGPSEEPFDVKMGSQTGLLVSVVNLVDFPLFS